MLLDWMRKVHQLEYAHRYQSLYWSQWHRPLEIAVMVLATMVAFSYQLPKVDEKALQNLPLLLRHGYFVPVASTFVAVLTGLITLLQPHLKADYHRKIGTDYERLRHEIESIYTSNHRQEDLPRFVEPWKRQWDNLGAPNVSSRCFERGKRRVKELSKYPEELGFLEDIAVEDGSAAEQDPGN